MPEYVNMWKNYVNFEARTTVRGYWMAFLFNFIVGIIISIIARVPALGFLSWVYSLAVFLPSTAIIVRRLRDAGKSWANIFWLFLPLVGVIILIVLLCKPSMGDNGVPVV